MRCSWLASVLSLFLLSKAKTITIDDSAPDPTNGNAITYFPNNGWISGAIGGCPGCSGPSTDIAYMNTWHAGLFNGKNQNQNAHPLSASITFYGTSVRVTCILSDSLTNPAGITEMRFHIDEQVVGNFTHTPTGAGGFVSNVTVFQSDPLALKFHNLIIENGIDGISLAILDSISYNIPDEPSSSGGAAPASSSSTLTEAVQTHPSNVAAIVGAVFAVLAVLLLLGLAFLYIRHRRNQHRSNVPLSTTMAAPIGRIRSLWSGPPRPPPDMAPVPFPSPAQQVSRTAATGPSSSPSPRPAPSAPSPQRSRLSMLSFNPNLLVGRFQRRPPPPPISTLPPPDTRVASPALRSGNPLLPEPSAQVEPRDVITSIQQWQRRTLQEAANEPPIHPLDMSEVDLSSHYDSTGDSSGPPPAPPPPRSPQPPQRRFTVMNN